MRTCLTFLKYQAAKLAALLDNFEMYDKMLQDYSEGLGSAEIEAEKSANNISGSMNKLSNSFTEIIHDMLSSDTMLLGINTLNELLQLIGNVTESLGSLGTVGVVTTAVASLKGLG